jgi:hypothetical protein
MQAAVDILKILIFPGLLFMAISGSLILLLEGGLSSLLYGGKSGVFPDKQLWRRPETLPLTGQIIAAVSLMSLGLAGVLLIEMKTDLFIIVLLLSAAEMIAVFSRSALSPQQLALLPLMARAAILRMMTLFLVATAVSLRSPGSFIPQLDGFTHAGCFRALVLWSGYRYGLVVAGLILGLLALLIFDLGDPLYTYILKRPAPARIDLLLSRGAERAATTLLFVIIFLGYPWQHWTGLIAWSGSVLGTAIGLAVLRSWASGKDRVILRSWRYLGFFLALASLALMMAAAW